MLSIFIVMLFFMFPKLYQSSDQFQFIAQKLNKMSNDSTSEDKTGTSLDRIEYAKVSLRTFAENPVFGVDFAEVVQHEPFHVVGGHSSLFDSLAMYGLLGIIPLVIFHVYFLRNSLNAWKCRQRELAGVGEITACLLYIFCAVCNTATDTMLMYIMMFITLVPPKDVGLLARTSPRQ